MKEESVLSNEEINLLSKTSPNKPKLIQDDESSISTTIHTFSSFVQFATPSTSKEESNAISQSYYPELNTYNTVTALCNDLT